MCTLQTQKIFHQFKIAKIRPIYRFSGKIKLGIATHISIHLLGIVLIHTVGFSQVQQSSGSTVKFDSSEGDCNESACQGEEAGCAYGVFSVLGWCSCNQLCINQFILQT